MFLTVRDREMLQWINGHGFVTADQAALWMGVCDRVGRRRLQRLVEGGYLQKKRFALNDPQFHWLTKEGWHASGDNLAPPKRINRVTYFHDWALVDLAQQLVATTKGDFVPERHGEPKSLGESAVGPRVTCLTGFSISATTSRLRSNWRAA